MSKIMRFRLVRCSIRTLTEIQELQVLRISGVTAAAFVALLASAADFRPPAGERSALIAAAGSILPGGRLLRPLGTEIETGPGPLGLALSPGGGVGTANAGYERVGITLIEPPGKSGWKVHHIWGRTPHGTAPEIADPAWRGVSGGIAFDSTKAVWVSEGASGKIRLIDADTGDARKTVNLNSHGWLNSFTADLAFDRGRHLLYAIDRANLRVAAIDAKTGRVLSSVRMGREPFAIALSPDGASAWIAGSDPDSVCEIDVRDAAKPLLGDCIPTESPQAVLATADRVYVSNAGDDSITVISTREHKIEATIPLRIPALESLRGIVPAGLAYDPVTKWLLVAEAGINAVGVVDTERNLAIAHLPAGWMPTRVAISGDRVYVANALGRGTGPNLRHPLMEFGEAPTLHRGMVTTFAMPSESELPRETGVVFVNNGFLPRPSATPEPPAAIRHVVLIVRGGRTFDEVLGDVAGEGRLARFGMHGRAEGHREQFSVQDAQITPNAHAAARHWAYSDNFYADGDGEPDGHRWLTGAYTDLRAETEFLTGFRDRAQAPEPLWHHLESHSVTFGSFDEKDETKNDMSDQSRADRFIAELEHRYGKGGEPLPGFLYLRLPNDRAPEAQPERGYPYDASFVEDNDLAFGRILDYLSHSPWWPGMVVFTTESNAREGLDHIDAHRTLLLAAGPYVKRNYASHMNVSFPGLLRTIFELLRVPPLNLMDATAADLDDLFTVTPDFTPFTAGTPDPRIFDASRIK